MSCCRSDTRDGRRGIKSMVRKERHFRIQHAYESVCMALAPKAGLEPARLSAHAPHGGVSSLPVLFSHQVACARHALSIYGKNMPL